MPRTAARLAGLLVAGPATVGPVTLDVPELLRSSPTGRRDRLGPEEATVPRLESVDGPEFEERAVALVRGDQRLDLRFPIVAPEISGAEGVARSVSPGVGYVHWPPPDADWDALRRPAAELVVLGNARALWRSGEPFVRALLDLRRRLGAGPLLWAPRVGLPHRLALLAWLGVDLVDTTEGLWQASEGTFLDPTLGAVSEDASRAAGACPCPGCRAPAPSPEGRALHAEFAFREEHGRVRAAVADGRLRELVEARLAAEPAAAEMLRYSDRLLGELLRERTPVVGGASRSYVLRESRRRPEVVRFVERVRARYRPPPSKRVLLLVPCSRTKPYRNSPSHRRFARAWEGWAPAPLLHVVSVSSPLGLVPRELEDVFPARQYDIPVTGDWEADERDAVRRALARIVETGRYTQAIAHLDPVEYGFLAGDLPAALHPRWTVADDRTTSPEALDALRNALDAADLGPDPPAGGALAVAREGLEALAAVQFGPEAARRLFEPPTRLEGRPWSLRLTDGHVDLATWAEGRGLFQLTVAGGRRVLPSGVLQVELDPGVALRGDLFVPGVRGADPGISPGDAVLLVRDGTLHGVGEAVLPGRLMTELRRGLAVRVRHHVPDRDRATDSSKSEAAARSSGPVV